MYVKDRMKTNIVSITKDVTISQALDIFATNDFHRLPVIDKHNHLIGLITEGVIQAHTPSKATSLSIHELNYLLSKTSVDMIMIKDVIVIKPDCLLEEAAEKMMENDISCLPVIDDENSLVGIITQKDIFTAFVDLLGYHDIGSRIVIKVDHDEVGVLAKIAKIMADNHISISHLAVYRNKTVDVVMRVDQLDGKKVVDILQKNGYEVTDVIVNDQK
ncbi:MAG: CBS domain-containing protein [Erysipelotrichaceae bacterium]|nr:CBS domain-containing protein [Erysipelotrichaceae bacterium]MDD4641902.1 CBS domain-containing protein [Erysipelotrichaceae bacterium]